MKIKDRIEQTGTSKQNKDFADIIEPAIERFKEIVDFEAECRPKMIYDRQFDDGIQWDQADTDNRTLEGRPCITIPRTNQFSDRLKNEQRQNKPAIQVSPVDDGAQEKAAQNRQGLLRRIQYESRAQIARQWAFNCAVTEGRGHWRINTEYVNDTSDNQDIVVDIVKEPLNVYLDWRRQMPDYSDCKYGFIVRRVSRKLFKEEYPKAQPSDWYADLENEWINNDDITVVEYFCEKTRERELMTLERNGERTKIWKDQLHPDEKIQPSEIVKSRKVDVKYWMWYKMTTAEILDRRELKGIRTIPIMTVVGKETIIQGKLNIKGIIRDLMRPQKMYNFWASQETEWVSMAPKAPFIGAEGQFEGYEDVYQKANTITSAFLPYKPISHDGHLVPAPQRQMPPTIPPGIVQAKQEIIDDMKAITGIYDSSLGAKSNETSGVAIRQREMQGDTASFHYIDNFRNALEHEGRVENDMLPIYYDDPNRRIKIMGEDDEVSMLQLGEVEKGELVTLGDGAYDIRVEVGPSFTTQRQESAANMIELAGKIPAIGTAAPDVAVKMLDFNGKDEMAERTKRLTEMQFPGLTAPIEDDADQEGQEMQMITQQLQQAQQQMQQMAQEREQMVQEFQKIDQTKIQNEAQKTELEGKKLELEAMKAKSDKEIEEKKIEMQAMIADLENETKLKIEEMKHIGDVSKLDRDAQHKAKAAIAEEEREIRETEEQVINVKVENKQPPKNRKIMKVKGGYEIIEEESAEEKASVDIESDEGQEGIPQRKKPVVNVVVDNPIPKKGNRMIKQVEGGYEIVEGVE